MNMLEMKNALVNALTEVAQTVDWWNIGRSFMRGQLAAQMELADDMTDAGPVEIAEREILDVIVDWYKEAVTVHRHPDTMQQELIGRVSSLILARKNAEDEDV